MNEPYRHSNKFSPQGLIAGAFFAIVAATLGGFLYVYGIWSIPSVKLRILCPMAYGALVGAGAGLGMYWGKVRNLKLAGMTSFASGSLALYLSWVIWIYHLMFPSYWLFNPVGLALQPKLVWKIVVSVNAQGTWAMKGSAPMTGTSLWLIWLAEAAFIVGFGVLTGVAVLKQRPFCERCDNWCAEKTKLYVAPTVHPNEIKSHVETLDLAWIGRLPRGDKKKANYRIDLRSCGQCHAVNTLSLTVNFPRDRRILVDKVLLSEDQASSIRSLALERDTPANSPTVVSRAV